MTAVFLTIFTKRDDVCETANITAKRQMVCSMMCLFSFLQLWCRLTILFSSHDQHRERRTQKPHTNTGHDGTAHTTSHTGLISSWVMMCWRNKTRGSVTRSMKKSPQCPESSSFLLGWILASNNLHFPFSLLHTTNSECYLSNPRTYFNQLTIWFDPRTLGLKHSIITYNIVK